MSTGMRQKTALAAVLAVDVPLLVLDEPTSNLDPSVRRTVQALIREAQAAGRTVIFSSHVLSEVEQVCDRVAILRAGRVVHDQAMATVRRGHRIRARLAGALPQAPEQPSPYPEGEGFSLRAPEPMRAAVTIVANQDGWVTIDAPGDLAPLLGWLATLPLAEVHIEPIGLAAVYEKFHPAESGEGAAQLEKIV
jgi:ABC-2 type transport system ATP-binding protein